MKTPVLIPIDLRKCFASKDAGGGSYHDHPDIKRTKFYLAKIGSEFYAGRFTREWYGWSFDGWGGGGGLQLDKPGTNSSNWKALWEVSKGKS